MPMKETNNSLDMTADMSDGIVAADLREWLIANNTEHNIAVALAQSNMKKGWLMHDLCDPDTTDLPRVRLAYNEWRELYEELHARIFSIMEKENDLGVASHNLSETRGHYVIMPFMERNGYRDGSGWWVRK